MLNIKFGERNSPCLLSQVFNGAVTVIQEAFSHLIGEQSELTQELASQGLSIVYEIGDDAMKKNLVNALVGTLTGSGKRKRAVKVGTCGFLTLCLDIISFTFLFPICLLLACYSCIISAG